MHKEGGSNKVTKPNSDYSDRNLQKCIQLSGSGSMARQTSSKVDEMENSFEQSDLSSNYSETSEEDIDEQMVRQDSRLERRIEQINPSDLMHYNNLIEQFNQGI